MTQYESYINREVKNYDRELFLCRDSQGLMCVMRKHYEYVAYDVDGSTLNYLTYAPRHVVALTSNWQKNGVSREYGADIILNKLRSMDFWHNQQLFEELDREEEKIEASRKRDFKNKIEDFWSDTRDKFKESTKDILTHSLDKNKPLLEKRKSKWEL